MTNTHLDSKRKNEEETALNKYLMHICTTKGIPTEGGADQKITQQDVIKVIECPNSQEVKTDGKSTKQMNLGAK